MGMTGLVFVRPPRTHTPSARIRRHEVRHNDGDGSTRYNREFGLMMTRSGPSRTTATRTIQRLRLDGLGTELLGDERALLPGNTLPPRKSHQHRGGRLQYQPNSSADHRESKAIGCCCGW